MKYLRLLSIAIFAAAFLFAGCSFLKRSTSSKANADRVPITSVAIDGDGDEDGEQASTLPPKYALMTPVAAKTILLDANISDLINSKQDESYSKIYNGFGDKNHWRIEFYFSKVKRDSLDPSTLYVEGKTRYKKKIAAFSGTLHVDSVFSVVGDTSYPTDYHLKGKFQLAENKATAGNGNYSGMFCMDIETSDDNHNNFYQDYSLENETKHGGFLMDGKWTAYANGNSRPVLAASEFFNVAENILTDFVYGERDRSVSEKYRPFGWDTYWENEEWWNDGKATTSSL